MTKTYTFLTLLMVFSALSAQTTKRTLFIGNSYTASNNLPQMIADVAASVGDVLEYDMNVPGGYTFELHTENPTTLSLIAEGTWDYVILQEQSQIPSFPIDEVEALSFPFAKTLDSLILDANSCTETMFFMTWGRKDGDAMNCPTWPPVCTYDGMDSLLHERYMQMGADNAAEVSPVGAVWHYIRDNHPEIELYSGDGSHPSVAGSYAAACAFYAAIFRKDPQLITYDHTLTADQASAIRSAARAVVFDSLYSWYIGTYAFAPHAAFTANTDTPLTAFFDNTSTGAGQYLWDLGDGATSTVFEPEHVYASAGVYTVTLTAIMCDTSNITTAVIEISAEETTGITGSENAIALFPNPAKDMIQLRTYRNIQPLFIADAIGRMQPIVAEIADHGYTIHISCLAPGMYVLVAEQNGSLSSMRFVKE